MNFRKFLLLLIILTSIFLRFYKLDDYMNFLGDEGRDALVVKRMLVDHKFTLLGPATSVGNMYLGPLYYYLMIIPMAIFGLNPIGPAMMVALFGVITVYLVYKITNEWFGDKAAFISSALYAVSPSIISHTRSSWNPNPMPLFSLLLVYSLYKVYVGKPKWIAVTIALLAVILQLHYMGMFLGGLIIFITGISAKANTHKYRITLAKYFVVGVGLFFLLMGPFILFEFRHGFINVKALITFVKENQNPNMVQRKTDFNPLSSFTQFIPVWDKVFERILPIAYNKFSAFIAVSSLLLSFLALIKNKLSKKTDPPLFILLSWMAIGIFGVSFYKGFLNDHYLGFLFPIPFILFGYILSKYLKNKLLISITVIIMVVINLKNVDLVVSSGDKQLKRTREVAEFIIERSGSKPFNFALVSDHNYEDPYVFFFEILGKNPVDTSVKIEEQLFVVCEGQCSPIGHPKWGIASFGWAKIEDEWQLDGRKVYKLAHFTP